LVVSDLAAFAVATRPTTISSTQVATTHQTVRRPLPIVPPPQSRSSIKASQALGRYTTALLI
jgi:hypothetical protein